MDADFVLQVKCTIFWLNMFHSEILASWNFDKNKILSPGLENNRTLKCCFGNFSTWICQECWKNTRSAFECIVILKSRAQGPKKIDNLGTNLSRTCIRNLNLVPWIGEEPYIPMLIWYFSNHLDIYYYVGKLPEQHFSI